MSDDYDDMEMRSSSDIDSHLSYSGDSQSILLAEVTCSDLLLYRPLQGLNDLIPEGRLRLASLEMFEGSGDGVGNDGGAMSFADIANESSRRQSGGSTGGSGVAAGLGPALDAGAGTGGSGARRSRSGSTLGEGIIHLLPFAMNDATTTDEHWHRVDALVPASSTGTIGRSLGRARSPVPVRSVFKPKGHSSFPKEDGGNASIPQPPSRLHVSASSGAVARLPEKKLNMTPTLRKSAADLRDMAAAPLPPSLVGADLVSKSDCSLVRVITPPPIPMVEMALPPAPVSTPISANVPPPILSRYDPFNI